MKNIQGVIKITCEECEKIQDKAFDKNIPESVPIAYYRIKNANIAIIGCNKHVKMAIEKLNKT